MEKFLEFIKKNKRSLIQIGGAAVGTLMGIGITALIISVQDEEFDLEEEPLINE